LQPVVAREVLCAAVSNTSAPAVEVADLQPDDFDGKQCGAIGH
jgi:hypothetical protein